MIQVADKAYNQIVIGMALGAIIVFGNLYFFQAMLPLLAIKFHATTTNTNWVFAASTLGLSVFLIPCSIFSESIGRRKMLFFGLFSLPVIGVLMLFCNNLFELTLLRFLQGLSMAAFLAVAVAYMIEELSSAAFSKAMATYVAANAFGGLLGRVSGGILADLFGLNISLVCMICCTLMASLLVHQRLPHQLRFNPSVGMHWHHARSVVRHFKELSIWLVMLIGALNFMLFVNLFSVINFRMVAPPHQISVAAASLIYLCYIPGTISSTLTAHWKNHFSVPSGMAFGGLLSMMGMLTASVNTVPMMLIGLTFIASGGFFIHTLAYAWTSEQAKSGKTSASALYLVHYYVGGGLGGFYLLHFWETNGWLGVVLASLVLYGIIWGICLLLSHRITHQRKQQHQTSTPSLSPVTTKTD